MMNWKIVEEVLVDNARIDKILWNFPNIYKQGSYEEELAGKIDDVTWKVVMRISSNYFSNGLLYRMMDLCEWKKILEQVKEFWLGDFKRIIKECNSRFGEKYRIYEGTLSIRVSPSGVGVWVKLIFSTETERINSLEYGLVPSIFMVWNFYTVGVMIRRNGIPIVSVSSEKRDYEVSRDLGRVADNIMDWAIRVFRNEIGANKDKDFLMWLVNKERDICEKMLFKVAKELGEIWDCVYDRLGIYALYP